MPCYHPLPAWFGRTKTPAGKPSIVFNQVDAWCDKPIDIPCGRCIGCRLERARHWATRCMHEAQQHSSSVFATLTYDDANLPPGGSLRPEDFVLFMKRLRKSRPPGVRFFQCGEYGEQLERPHHHALLFNCSFPDSRKLPNASPQPLHHSPELDDLWRHGLTTYGAVTFESAAYVARYSLKKINGPTAAEHYAGRLPEYATMSRRPGIGSTWLQQFTSDVYPDDAVTIRGGIKTRPPRYYDNELGKTQPRLLKRLKLRRAAQQRDNPDNSGKRLIVREAVKTAAIRRTTRTYEAQP